MPFDPTKPETGSPLASQQMREQLNALNDRIAALEAALGGTAQNPNLGQLSIGLSDPPSRDEVLQILSFLNTLLNQITRV